MLLYILKRLLHTIPLLLAMTLTIFILIDAMPGNELTSMINSLPEGTPRPTYDQMQQMMTTLQYDKPWHQRYFTWLTDSLQGDFGTSLYYRKPAQEVLGTIIWRTFSLNGIALCLIFVFAVPLGVRSAVWKGSPFDQLVSLVSLVLLSIPSFFIGLYLMRLLAVNISWLPATGMHSVKYLVKGYPSLYIEILDVATHMVIPSLTLALAGFGIVTRFIRNAVIDVINQDYVRTAKSKGLTERVVIYRHAFRNAWIPIISLLGMMIPQLFIGNIFVEAVFSWPGIGLEFLSAVFRRDTAIISLILLFFSCASVFGSIIADVLYGFADPRIVNT